MVVEGVANGPNELTLQNTAEVKGEFAVPVASLSDSKPLEVPDAD
jgi:hypothetical protein